MALPLSFKLKDCFHILTQDSRWDVLTVLILHSNTRNRCWPSTKTIARMATNGNQARALRAKKWLQECGAFVLVPYAKRCTDADPRFNETTLPKRQHIYELTGQLTIDGKVYPYFYTGRETYVDEVLEGETYELETSDLETSNPTVKVVPEKISSTNKDPAPNGAHSETKPLHDKPAGPKTRRDALYDAVEEMYTGEPSQDDNRERMAGGRVGKISNWLAGTYEGKGAERVGKISAPALPRHVAQFAAWYKQNNEGANLPRDFVRFVEQWRTFAVAQKRQAAAQQRTAAQQQQFDDIPTASAEDRAAMIAMMREKRAAQEQEAA